ncbi:unnamed protein product [Acanthoscelides obtectus]|uniref:HAT C-terminal dimerisation domain-containing protein n=1 Tax=Acanthoscelides obtectus TaxID=200917 RepID=A0A9P0LQ07_ACAOB|nr:unnamed protein product [Acanthoscelides obtectus]CAK1683254.1 Zinc finger BED domain-containing protein 1 [Acanthoscelides obtectus]
MLKRFVDLKDDLKSTIAVLDKDLPVLRQEEWEICDQLCRILKPFEGATKTISGEKYATASLVIPLVNGLKSVCLKLTKKDFHPDVIQVVLKLNSGLFDRFESVERSNTLTACTFLDPRFKMLVFDNEQLSSNVKKNIIGIVTAKFLEKQTRNGGEETVNNNQCSDSESEDELSVWGSFKKTVSSSTKPKATASSQAIIEVQRYLEEDLLPRNEDPCKWWRDFNHYYPVLSEVIREKFCALATSVPCERLFSKAGLIISERRSRLKAHKARMLVF